MTQEQELQLKKQILSALLPDIDHLKVTLKILPEQDASAVLERLGAAEKNIESQIGKLNGQIAALAGFSPELPALKNAIKDAEALKTALERAEKHADTTEKTIGRILGLTNRQDDIDQWFQPFETRLNRLKAQLEELKTAIESLPNRIDDTANAQSDGLQVNSVDSNGGSVNPNPPAKDKGLEKPSHLFMTLLKPLATLRGKPGPSLALASLVVVLTVLALMWIPDNEGKMQAPAGDAAVAVSDESKASASEDDAASPTDEELFVARFSAAKDCGGSAGLFCDLVEERGKGQQASDPADGEAESRAFVDRFDPRRHCGEDAAAVLREGVFCRAVQLEMMKSGGDAHRYYALCDNPFLDSLSEQCINQRRQLAQVLETELQNENLAAYYALCQGVDESRRKECESGRDMIILGLRHYQ